MNTEDLARSIWREEAGRTGAKYTGDAPSPNEACMRAMMRALTESPTAQLGARVLEILREHGNKDAPPVHVHRWIYTDTRAAARSLRLLDEVKP